ncbi:MAG: S8 family serine peptidase [Myxococcota bacterium]
MRLDRHDMLPVILPGRPRHGGRFVQDTRITAEVWLALGRNESGPTDLLLNPEKEEAPRDIVASIDERFTKTPIDIAFNETEAVATLTLEQLVQGILPMTHWWADLWEGKALSLDWKEVEKVVRPSDIDRGAFSPDLLWLLRIVALLAWAKGATRIPKAGPARGPLTKALRKVLSPALKIAPTRKVYRVNLNRDAVAAMRLSVPTVKADAAIRLFEIRCNKIRWAVLDSGIDAKAPSFLRDGDGPWKRRSRVRRTYDFRRLRDLFRAARAGELDEFSPEDAATLQRTVSRGGAIDWSGIEPFLEVPHDDDYTAPSYPHGTQVAAVLGGDLESDEGRVAGVCPDIELWDLRVLDENGEGKEFDILAALQFLRFKNAQRGTFVVHGANLSLSLEHDVVGYGCGHTPVCREASRLVGSGVVVVAAAGNNGYVERERTASGVATYRDSSITDPGNAADVITVGSTHRTRPHTYGVSYFSSRGPTGDGRIKPDLVAPGEKLEVPSLDGEFSNANGTSLAAPHVSGAAALLMARHRELIGDPARVKRALCETATDLGRDRYVQGHGLVDVLRAIQSL